MLYGWAKTNGLQNLMGKEGHLSEETIESIQQQVDER